MDGAFLVAAPGETPQRPGDGGSEQDEGRAPQGPTVTLELVARGLVAPVFMTAPEDGTGRLFVVDQVGQIRIVDENGSLVERPFLDVSDRIVELDREYDERGLLGLAFHPEYRDNGRFYVYYSAPLRGSAPNGWNHTAHVSEFQVADGQPNRADPASERVIMRIDQPQGNHNGGHIAFGPDGMLYIPLGDGGLANDTGPGHPPEGNGQDLSTLLGSILRIDVDAEGDGGRPYGIPEDNPFAGDDSARPEIFAYGFRNPYHLSFDAGGDRALYVSDAGQDRFEEVARVQAGENHGWRIKEGTHCFDPEQPSNPPSECPDTGARGEPLVDPVIEYGRLEIRGSVVVGGYMYRGDSMPDLQGTYIFGDYSTDRVQPDGVIFMARPATEGLWELEELGVTVQGQEDGDGRLGKFVLSFGEDEDRDLYVGVIERGGPAGVTGAVYRFAASSDAGESGAEIDGDGTGATSDGDMTIWLIAAALLLLGGIAIIAASRRRGDRAAH